MALEISPEHGGYHTLNVELAPGAPEELPYRWMRSTLSLRQYVPIYTDRLVFAARLMSDSLLGQPPFYELARADNSAAIGGSKGIRGIPALRYHGNLKLLSNFELRVRWLTFRLFGKSNQLGTVAFADAGRLWADYHRLTELDGGGLGLKLGFGAGLRLRAGKSFVLRADFASSSEGGFSGYLGPGHVF